MTSWPANTSSARQLTICFEKIGDVELVSARNFSDGWSVALNDFYFLLVALSPDTGRIFRLVLAGHDAKRAAGGGPPDAPDLTHHRVCHAFSTGKRLEVRASFLLDENNWMTNACVCELGGGIARLGCDQNLPCT